MHRSRDELETLAEYLDRGGLNGRSPSWRGELRSGARANLLIDRFNYARGYFEARPPYLECFRELAVAFPPNEKIWVTCTPTTWVPCAFSSPRVALVIDQAAALEAE